MIKRLMVGGLALVLGGALLGRIAFADDGPKNLKVLPSSMSRADVKKFMKEEVAKGLGVTCDHCHNEDDFSADSAKKDKARAMMKMVADVNKTYFDGKQRVHCVTCHDGSTTPKPTP